MAIKILTWDTEFFNKNVGELKVSAGDKIHASEAATEARKLNLECLYIRIPSDQTSLIAEFEKLGAAPAARQVLLEKTLTDSTSLPGPDDVRHEDLPSLTRLFESLSSQSRFAADDRFGKAEAARLYRAWFEATLKDPEREIFLSRNSGEVHGFVTTRRRDNHWMIDLVAVAPSAQGKGLAGELLKRAECWVRTKGGRKMQVVTQDLNSAALSAYGKFGFQEVSRETVLHLWFS